MKTLYRIVKFTYLSIQYILHVVILLSTILYDVTDHGPKQRQTETNVDCLRY